MKPSTKTGYPHAERAFRKGWQGQRANQQAAIGLPWDSPLRFVAAFAREPLKIGAVWPSSKVLSRTVVDCCAFKTDDLVVELGAGTGAFTGLLLKRLSRRGQLLAVEINPANADVLRRRFPYCDVIEDSAENLVAYLNGQKADCIVSGLAWGSMFPQTQDGIFQAILDSLRPGGQFIAFAYAHAAWLPTALRFRQNLFRHFKSVESTPIIWRNLPPAFVYCCRR
jgi:phospholipid N-methyltransferase